MNNLVFNSIGVDQAHWLDDFFPFEEEEVRGAVFAVVCPRLFMCASDHLSKVSQYMSRAVDLLQWGPIFRRNLTEEEKSQLVSLLEILS